MGNRLTTESCFLDAGSGIGKAVLAAGLLFPFKKCIGVEALEQLDSLGIKFLENIELDKIFSSNEFLFPLHKIDKTKEASNAIVVSDELEENKTNDNESDTIKRTNYNIPELGLKCGNFLEENWSQYDIIFVNSTAFETDLMKEITKKAQEMKAGSLLITVTKRILEALDTKWKLFDGFRQQMNFGSSTIYFHRVRDLKSKVETESKVGDNDSVFNFTNKKTNIL